MHDTQTVAVLVMCALEFENQLALGLGISDSSSTLAQEVIQTHASARNFGHLYRFEEIEVAAFPMCPDCMYDPAWCMNCSALSHISSTISKLKLWRTESLSRSTKLKLLLMPRVNRRDHSAGPAQIVSRQATRALFKSVLNCCCTAPVTRSVASVPCKRSSSTFLRYKVGT
jgi:hypothetical protein